MYRYEDSRILSREQVHATRGKLVTFYKNGDAHFKGLPVSISLRQFKKYDTLLRWLDEKIPTPKGIRHIFQLPLGYEIFDLEQFENGLSYVVSSTSRLRRNVYYGDSRERHWVNKPLSASYYRKQERHLLTEETGEPQRLSYSYPVSRTGSQQSYPYSERQYRSLRKPARVSVSQSWRQQENGIDDVMDHKSTAPHVLTVISNTNRNSCEKVRDVMALRGLNFGRMHKIGFANWIDDHNYKSYCKTY